MSALTFDPKDLESVDSLCKEGVIHHSLLTIRRLSSQGKFPAVKVAKNWMTTRAAVRGFYYKKANAAFRRIAA